MSRLTTDHPRRATSEHRVQVAAEAVVSAYINEITPTQRSRERVRARHSYADSSPRAIARSPLVARSRCRALAPRHRTALELGAERMPAAGT